MKEQNLSDVDKLLLRKRALIESVNDELKNICSIEHTRHRAPKGFLINLSSELIAYQFLPTKPSLNVLTISPKKQFYETTITKFINNTCSVVVGTSKFCDGSQTRNTLR